MDISKITNDDIEVTINLTEEQKKAVAVTAVSGEADFLSQPDVFGSELQPKDPLATYDTNLEKVLGSQRLVSDDAQKLKSEAYAAPDLRVFGFIRRVNDEVIINLNGHATVAFQLIGTWAGTISFYATMDGVTWYAYVANSNASATATSNAVSSTANGLWQAKVSGIKAFKVQCTAYTSGTCQALLAASYTPTSHQSAVVVAGTTTVSGTVTATCQGSQTQTLPQRPIVNNGGAYELLVQDSAHRETFYIIEPWNSNVVYYYGDVVLWNNQVYRCILQTVLTAGNISPTNTTYWVAEKRPVRSLATRDYVSSPDSPRVRVQQDLLDYQYRLQESMMLKENFSVVRGMEYQDATLLISQQYGGADGNAYSIGKSGMSNYIFEEIR
jgi:hypothetical protein